MTEHFADLPDGFRRTRLFPLPNLVVFPGATQPLHIFEPRYREMLECTLDSDGTIAMGLLEPGWENDYEGRPPVHPLVCVGRVATHSRDDQGRYNIILIGARRARILHELPPDELFREIEVELLEDEYLAKAESQRQVLRRHLMDAVLNLASSDTARSELEQLFSRDLTLGALSDAIAFSVGFDIEFKQRMLAELVVDQRVHMLTQEIQRATQGNSSGARLPFPPRFSDN